LTFRLFGQDVSASAALERVGDAAERAGNRVSGAFDSIRNVAGGYLIGNAVSQVAQWGEQLVQFGLTTTATMEQAQIGFTSLLGSASAAGDYLKQLNAFAAATPFTFPGVEHGAQQLLGVGVAAQQVIPILTDLGDAAGANAIDQAGFERVMVGVTQSISAGTIKLQDMNQIADSMPAVWKLLSEALGKPMPVIRDMISKSQLLSADVLPKLFAQMHKDYGGAMAQQSQTLAGLWSTLTDTIGQGMAKVLTPLEPLMKQGITGAINAVGGAVTWVSGAFAQFGPAVAKVRDYFGPLIGVVEELWGWITGSLWPALQAGWAQEFPAIKGAIADVSSVLRDHAGLFQTLGNVLTQIVLPTLSQLATWIWQLVGPALRLIATILEEVVLPVLVKVAQAFV
jgi:tape measure domain-containing protein